ncbi:Neuropeptide CCHamide-1 receptor, partial [Lamellibrachia satsuma]
EAYLVPVLFLIIFVVGVLGNGALIFIVARNASLHNVPNILIVNLACGDLLLILVSVPFTATIYTLVEWPYGEPMCRVNEFLQCMSLGVSVFTLIALSLDRYVAIAHPLSRRKTSPVCRTASLAVAIWLLSVLLAIPVAVVSHVEYYPDGPAGERVGICVRQPHTWGETYRRWQAIFNFVVFFALPMLIICAFYALMARILIASSSNMPGVGKASTAGRAQAETRNKVARLVLSFVAVFVVCWLPRHIYVLWFHFAPGEYNMFWHVFKIVGFCLSFTNSCVNPLALYFLSNQFRRHYNNVLFCCCRSRLRHASAGRTGSCAERH